MKGVVAWFAANGVAANLLMAVIIIAGLMTVPRIRKEVFPDFSIEMISISVPYPGAAPQEVEEAICARIEERIQSLTGIKRITSTASEAMGVVTVEVLEGTDVREMLDDVKSRIDAIETFPEEAEKPVIQEIEIRPQVVNVAISGDAGEKTLKHLGERVRDEIASLSGITQVELANARPYEISIEVSEEALRRHGLTFDDVARAVRLWSLDMPGGSVKTEGGEILLRTKGQAYVGEEFTNLVLLSRPDGTRLLLGDVAQVVDGFAETDQSARFGGKPAVLVQVFRVGDQSALEISGAVSKYVESAQDRMPQGIQLTIWQDDAKILESRLSLLLRNGGQGLLLVVAILTLFLRPSLAFWVSLGIPISFLGTLLLMPTLDISVNLISLFAFICVLGIVVDDAIVVGENIYSHYESGKPAKRAVVDGAMEMLVPVVFAVLTTIVAFSPLLVLPGATGKFMRVIPLVVITTLVFSLVESLLILPTHLSHRRRRQEQGRVNLADRFQNAVSASLHWFIHQIYKPFLAHALEWRYLTAAMGVVLLILAIGLIGGGWTEFVYFPDVEADNVIAFLTMPQGTPAEVTTETVQKLEHSAEILRQQLDSELDWEQAGENNSVFTYVVASVGEQPFRAAQNRIGVNAGRFGGSHLGEVNIELAPAEVRASLVKKATRQPITSTEIANRWRDLTGQVPDAVELTFTASLFSAGEPINIQLAGPDLDQLRNGAEELKDHLGHYPGVYDISDSFRAGKQEIKLGIRPAAETLGLTLADLARQVRQAFYGEEAQRIQRGRDEVKVMVRYPARWRRSLGDLEDMRIRSPGGQEVPFSAVATSQLGRGFDSIRRVDRNRAINVTAEVDDVQANANEILRDLENSFLPRLISRYPGLNFSLEGQQREQRDMMDNLTRGFALALLLIYTLLAVPLKSYSQPLIIMSAIPFGLIGAVLGHMIMALPLTILSMFGIVALAGVVVNDSLILVDYINRSRRAGNPLFDSVKQAGVARFRPIFADLTDYFWWTHPTASGEKSAGAVPHPHGSLSGLWRHVLDGCHFASDTVGIPDHGRP